MKLSGYLFLDYQARTDANTTNDKWQVELFWKRISNDSTVCMHYRTCAGIHPGYRSHITQTIHLWFASMLPVVHLQILDKEKTTMMDHEQKDRSPLAWPGLLVTQWKFCNEDFTNHPFFENTYAAALDLPPSAKKEVAVLRRIHTCNESSLKQWENGYEQCTSPQILLVEGSWKNIIRLTISCCCVGCSTPCTSTARLPHHGIHCGWYTSAMFRS